MTITPVELLLSKLPDAKRSSKDWSAKCPSHEDRRPSLSITEGDDGRALVPCHAVCTRDDIHTFYKDSPVPKSGTGNWTTGDTREDDELIVFMNIDVPGTTGHDFDNKDDPDEKTIEWFGKPDTHSGQPTFQKLLSGELTPH